MIPQQIEICVYIERVLSFEIFKKLIGNSVIFITNRLTSSTNLGAECLFYLFICLHLAVQGDNIAN